MHKSVDRILVSHVGSLPRGDELGNMLIEDEASGSVDKHRLEELIEQRERARVQRREEDERRLSAEINALQAELASIAERAHGSDLVVTLGGEGSHHSKTEPE